MAKDDKKKEPKPEPRTFKFACNVVGVPPVLASQYEQLLPPPVVQSIVSLLDKPNRFWAIRETLFAAIDEASKASAEPEPIESGAIDAAVEPEGQE